MHIDRAAIVAALRARGLTGRADWVERQLPTHVDTALNASLLQTLGIDLADIAPQHFSSVGADVRAGLAD